MYHIIRAMVNTVSKEEEHLFDNRELFTKGITLFSNYSFMGQPELGRVWGIPYILSRQKLSEDVINDIARLRAILTEEYKKAVIVINCTGNTFEDLENVFIGLMRAFKVIKN